MVTTPTMQQLLEAGVHFGHQVRRGHPRMQEYIYGARGGVHIINLEASEKKLKEAAEFVYNLGQEGKVLLLVGTKKQAQPIILSEAQRVGAPYMTARWIGGLLTNFDEIKKNIKRLNELKEKQDKGELKMYTKKEQLLIKKKVDKFIKEMGGIAAMDKLPDAIFLTDCVAEKTALVEADKVRIPIVGIADSNCNPTLVAYPIPGNDDATKSIKIIIEAITKAYEEGLKKGEKEKTARQEKEKKEAEEKTSPEELKEVKEAIAEAEEKIEEKAIEESERKV